MQSWEAIKESWVVINIIYQYNFTETQMDILIIIIVFQTKLLFWNCWAKIFRSVATAKSGD